MRYLSREFSFSSAITFKTYFKFFKVLILQNGRTPSQEGEKGKGGAAGGGGKSAPAMLISVNSLWENNVFFIFYFTLKQKLSGFGFVSF